tara:strand:- start:53 stop:547 length:495 start_codon:yes stop_codon:yes gene_type:complete
MSSKILIDKIDLFLFDFDGVLTDNNVYVDETGIESVKCNRSDGLGFQALQKLSKLIYIVSTETNPVVSVRAKKLNVNIMQGVVNKLEAMNLIIKKHKIDKKKVIFIGNDLNDYKVMKNCYYSACPLDSHPKIKNIASFVLDKKGGEGVVIDLVENILGLDIEKL